MKLEDVLNESQIVLGAEAADWEEAVQKAAAPLVENGKVTPDYVTAILKNVEEAGPYIVIIPHVALPHARPEAGALANALGIATLKTPVPFGSEGNDPVKYLFTLSATGNNEHISALVELSKLLENDAIFSMLDNATSPKEVMEWIRAQKTKTSEEN